MILALNGKVKEAELRVAPSFDLEDELALMIYNIRKHRLKSVTIWLPRSEVQAMRDYLTELLEKPRGIL